MFPPKTWLRTCSALFSRLFFFLLSGRCLLLKKARRSAQTNMEIIFDQIYVQGWWTKERNYKKYNSKKCCYNFIYKMPIMNQKHIRNEESDYWVHSCLKITKNVQSKEFPALEKCNRNSAHALTCAHEMLTLCKLRGSRLQLLRCLGILASKTDIARLRDLLLGWHPSLSFCITKSSAELQQWWPT